jgi:hypothetical protein
VVCICISSFFFYFGIICVVAGYTSSMNEWYFGIPSIFVGILLVIAFCILVWHGLNLIDELSSTQILYSAGNGSDEQKNCSFVKTPIGNRQFPGSYVGSWPYSDDGQKPRDHGDYCAKHSQAICPSGYSFCHGILLTG